MQRSYFSGVLFCLIATISWGTMFPVMTQVLSKTDPFTFTAMRYSIAAVAFTVLLLIKEGTIALKLRGERYFLAWLLGTAGFAGFGFLVFWGQQLAGPSGALTASIMMATMPMMGLLVNWILHRVRPPFYSFFFISLSFFGVVLVITKGDLSSIISTPQNYSAHIPLILGAFCWVIYTIGGSFFPKWSPYRYTAVTTLLGLPSIFMVNLILLTSGIIPFPSIQTTLSIIPHLIYMALVAGFIGVLSWNIGNKIITPLNGVLFMDVVPVTAFIISALTGVIPQNGQIIGASITAIALILNNIFQRRRMMRSPAKDSLPQCTDIKS